MAPSPEGAAPRQDTGGHAVVREPPCAASADRAHAAWPARKRAASMDSTETPAGAQAPTSDYVAETSFDDFALSPELRQGVKDRGYERPTPVQAATFRPVVEGKDVI